MSDGTTVLLRDQQRRWAEGERVLVEDYLRNSPQLGSDDDTFLKLIAHELLLRREAGETPTLEEYQQRFPQLAAELPPFFVLLPEIVPRSGDKTRREAPALDRPEAPFPHVPKYEVLGELGHGGMGVVYKARQTDLERVVALKMIRAGEWATPQERERFRTEALAAARLQHPNIVQIFEVGEHEGRPFLARELVNGPSLCAQLAGEPQPPHEAAEVVEVLARAMHHAHAHGIVHRDLKPENVLLSFGRERPAHAAGDALAGRSRLNEAVPKVADFGLAKRLDDASGKTATGALLGTPSYMAPEQARGKKDVGPAADVYALGAILYECLTGRPPFQGATPMETVDMVRTRDPVSPRTLRPGLPPELETICLACLEKEPQRRYASALELADELRRYLDGKPILRRPLGWWWRAAKYARRHPARAGVILSSAAAVTLASTLGPLTWYRGEVIDHQSLTIDANERHLSELDQEILQAEAKTKEVG